MSLTWIEESSKEVPNMDQLDINELNRLFKENMAPLYENMLDLNKKVQNLAEDRVTRSDFDALRREMGTNYVQREVLQPQMVSMADHINRIERDLKETRDIFERRMKEGVEQQLSDRDRAYVRTSQLVGWGSFALSLLALFLQHVHFS